MVPVAMTSLVATTSVASHSSGSAMGGVHGVHVSMCGGCLSGSLVVGSRLFAYFALCVLCVLRGVAQSGVALGHGIVCVQKFKVFSINPFYI